MTSLNIRVAEANNMSEHNNSINKRNNNKTPAKHQDTFCFKKCNAPARIRPHHLPTVQNQLCQDDWFIVLLNGVNKRGDLAEIVKKTQHRS